MKNKLKLSYKRIASRPVRANMQKFELSKKLFCIKFAKQLNFDTFIANIDEYSINKKLRQITHAAELVQMKK